MLTHYEVLRVRFDADLIEIRKAYRDRLLDVHPDKKNDEKKPALNVSVNAIQEAYRILSDERLRHEYDHEVIEGQKNSGYVGTGDGLDEYSLDEFEFDPETLRYAMSCPRCVAEDGFSFSEENLEEHAQETDSGGFQVLSQCSCCSLWLKVNFALAAAEEEEEEEK
ncbi:hypothetical protein ZYGR_0I07820 [Zygosaccharomyces rouxii]|uniref:Diphthamide biosynthesis protein 4 n=1 Tax=Zygosaccharomyces rouxii TaxID=4956 RepID=A0A1Q2ZYG1_ZYGRO|nr:hypothetical protein ZYGR_0I07820 [Zygosaccharomyces rouxii]